MYGKFPNIKNKHPDMNKITTYWIYVCILCNFINSWDDTEKNEFFL